MAPPLARDRHRRNPGREAAAPGLGTARGVGLAGLSVVICLGVVEVLVRSFDVFAAERHATHVQDPADAVEPGPAGPLEFQLHPFLGFAGNPRYPAGLIDEVELRRIFPDGPSAYYLRNSRINAQGFPSEHADYTKDDGAIHIGIFGGSVAEQLATIGGEALIAEFERREPQWRGRVRIFNAAIGGYKQPQQLIALILLTLQGVRFDAIVNVDGFNEVALSAPGEASYNPLFPSRFHWLPLLEIARGAVPERAIEGYADVIRARRAAVDWRSRTDRGWLAHSELARAIVGFAILRLEARAARQEQALQKDTEGPEATDEAAYDPACLRNPKADCWSLIADIWERSALQMAAIASRMGARYIEVLQPNQYDEGSKPLSALERRIAYDPSGDWPAGVRRGYPLLRSRIAEMLARGIDVADLTQLFGRTSDDVYIDTCCHYNLRGTTALALAVADRIAPARQ